MALTNIGIIGIPDSADSAFDHGAFEPQIRPLVVDHTGRSGLEVIDHAACKHFATVPGFAEAYAYAGANP